ncbi:MAG: hypothetical protein P0S95_00370 [Rhabdochlamydiaceae bacterium]|nr:hypothetical protein [Candidatus Amphrikana amoebophyrae]
MATPVKSDNISFAKGTEEYRRLQDAAKSIDAGNIKSVAHANLVHNPARFGINRETGAVTWYKEKTGKVGATQSSFEKHGAKESEFATINKVAKRILGKIISKSMHASRAPSTHRRKSEYGARGDSSPRRFHSMSKGAAPRHSSMARGRSSADFDDASSYDGSGYGGEYSARRYRSESPPRVPMMRGAGSGYSMGAAAPKPAARASVTEHAALQLQLEKTKALLAKKVAEHEVQIAELTSAHVEGKERQLEELTEKFEGRIAELTEQVEDLTAELNKNLRIVSKQAAERDETSTAKEELAGAKVELGHLKKENGRNEERIQRAEVEIEKLSGAIRDAKVEIVSLTRQLSESKTLLGNKAVSRSNLKVKARVFHAISRHAKSSQAARAARVEKLSAIAKRHETKSLSRGFKAFAHNVTSTKAAERTESAIAVAVSKRDAEIAHLRMQLATQTARADAAADTLSEITGTNGFTVLNTAGKWLGAVSRFGGEYVSAEVAAVEAAPALEDKKPGTGEGGASGADHK